MERNTLEQRIEEAKTLPVMKERISALRHLRNEVCQEVGRLPCGSVWANSCLVAGHIEELTGEREDDVLLGRP
jgi:hypothetical protein